MIIVWLFFAIGAGFLFESFRGGLMEQSDKGGREPRRYVDKVTGRSNLIKSQRLHLRIASSCIGLAVLLLILIGLGIFVGITGREHSSDRTRPFGLSQNAGRRGTTRPECPRPALMSRSSPTTRY